MTWFVKRETFNSAAAALSGEQRRPILEAHRRWVKQESEAGKRLCSGFLVDQHQLPGGGGLLIFEAESYDQALEWLQHDPMICSQMVTWSLHEWVMQESFFV